MVNIENFQPWNILLMYVNVCINLLAGYNNHIKWVACGCHYGVAISLPKDRHLETTDHNYAYFMTTVLLQTLQESLQDKLCRKRYSKAAVYRRRKKDRRKNHTFFMNYKYFIHFTFLSTYTNIILIIRGKVITQIFCNHVSLWSYTI